MAQPVLAVSQTQREDRAGSVVDDAEDPDAFPDPDDSAKATTPTELEGTSWKYVLKKTVREFSADECTDLAAGLTYYSIFAVFPGLLALLSILGVLGQADEAIDAIMDVLQPLVSPDILTTVRPVLEGFAASDAAGFGLVIGVLTALFSASGYVGAFGRAMNKVYEVEEGRPIWKLRPVMFALTIVSVFLVALALLLLVVSGPLLTSLGDTLGIGSTAVTVFGIAKWPLLLVVVIVLVGLLYYVAPNVQQPKFRWISVGAAVAIGVWVLLSVGFGFYVANFSNYSATYGALAGLIVALLYVWITNLALLFGAELDAELERGRQLQAGMAAEETLQLPPRDTAQIKKTRTQHDKDVALGRRIRRSAAQRQEQREGTTS